MAQALCWLAARLAGLAGVVATETPEVLLLPAGRAPVRPWILGFLARAGYVRRGEEPRPEGGHAAAARLRLATAGRVRAEFLPGAAAAFRGRVLREAGDFALLKALATGTGSAA